MTLQANFFQTNVTPLVDARDERRRTRLLTGGSSGVGLANDFKVTGVAGSLAVDVAACGEGGGLVWAPGRFNHRGSYFVYSDATERVTLNPSDVSQARTDLIVVRMHDGEYEGDASFTFAIDKVTGTPGGGVPAVTGDMYVLAQVAVAAGATTVGVITDRRAQLSTGTLPARSSSLNVSRNLSVQNTLHGMAPPTIAGYLATSGSDPAGPATMTALRPLIAGFDLLTLRTGGAGTSYQTRHVLPTGDVKLVVTADRGFITTVVPMDTGQTVQIGAWVGTTGLTISVQSYAAVLAAF